MKNYLKKLIGLFLAALLLFSLACQPTPEVPVVVNKGDGKSETAYKVSPETGQMDSTGQRLREKLGVPEKWTGAATSKNGILNIEFDANIVVPEVAKAPVAKMELRELTQQDIENIVEAVYGQGAQLYEPYGWTREELEAIISRQMADIELEKQQPDGGLSKKFQKELKYYENLYRQAPANIEKISTTLAIPKTNPCEPQAIGNVNGRNLTILITSQSVELSTPRDGGKIVDEYRLDVYWEPMPASPRISKEEAVQKATEIARKLDADLAISYISLAIEIQTLRTGWQCVFTRTLNGIPTGYESTERQGVRRGEDDLDMGEVCSPGANLERLCITIDDIGLCALVWVSPMKVDSIINDNVQLKDFDSIKETAMKQLEIKYSVDSYGNAYEKSIVKGLTLKIERVEFSLARVRQKDNLNAFLLVPVWDFYGLLETDYADAKLKEATANVLPPPGHDTVSYLTINAVDGSVIDRYLGY
jgi:hypothetical protein